MARKIAGIAAVVAAAMYLCSCFAGGVKIDKTLKEYETDTSSVKLETISFSGMANAEFEAELNDSVEKSAQSAAVAFDTNAFKCADNVRMGNKCIFETLWQIKHNGNDFISALEERYTYLGGAHGETAWLPRNIDLLTSKEIKLADLFAETGYENTLNRLINEEISENGEKYADLWEKPVIKDSHQTDFYIEDGDLVIFYKPYDLSYYARGFVEFRIDMEDISGYLKEEYRRLIE